MSMGRLTMTDQEMMIDAALEGAGIAYVFEAQVEQLIARRKLVRVLSDWCPAYPGFFPLLSKPAPVACGAPSLHRFC